MADGRDHWPRGGGTGRVKPSRAVEGSWGGGLVIKKDKASASKGFLRPGSTIGMYVGYLGALDRWHSA